MEPQPLHLDESENIPNHPEFPVLIYREAMDPDSGALARALERRFKENGWGGCWRWGVYDFHHYHSNAHEVLGVASGEAQLTIGGPGAETLKVRAGDVLVLPAGTGHKNESSSADFMVVGAYPAGQEDQDLVRNDHPVDAEIRKRIVETPLPKKDPVLGEDGPLFTHWRTSVSGD